MIECGDSCAETADKKNIFVVKVRAWTKAAGIFTNPFTSFWKTTRMAVTENLVTRTINFFFDQSFEKRWNRPTFGDWVTDVFRNKLKIRIKLFDSLSNIDNLANAVLHQFHIIVLE